MIDSSAQCQWLDSESKDWQNGYIEYESGNLFKAVEAYMTKKNCEIVVLKHPSGATRTFKKSQPNERR